MLNQELPKYLAVYEWLKENIENSTFNVGEKLISENQLCEKFSISRQTVRQAIAVLEQDGYVNRKRGSGTFINSVKSNNKKLYRNIALLTTYSSEYIFPNLISGVAETLSKHDYNFTLRLTNNKATEERSQLLSLLDAEIDGLIVEGTKSALPNPNLDLYKKFQEKHFPVVFINGFYHNLDFNYIINNDAEGARMAIRHLVKKGHEQIGGIFKLDDMQGHERYKGFLKEIQAQEIAFDESNILWYSTEIADHLFAEEQIPFLLKIFKDCTAILCYNDQVALRLIQLFANTFFKIPSDISIISFDDSSICEITSPTLTSITHPGKELGSLAAESLLSIIEDPQLKIQHIFEPKLIERKSVQQLNVLEDKDGELLPAK